MAVHPLMRRMFKLALDDFGQAALAAQCNRLGVPPARFVSRAAEYYLSLRGSDRAAYRVPRFSRSARRGRRGSGATEVELEGSVADQLDAEAAEQGVSSDRLLAHATMFLIADLDSGLVADRIAVEASGGEA